MDETFVGGKVKNMHKAKRAKALAAPDTFKGKTIVVGMLERGGKVRAGVVAERTKAVLLDIAHTHIAPDATLMTDELHAYKGVNLTHEVINHAEAYVRGHVHTNGIESFWSLLKRTLGGTYIAVEPFHLFRYIDEQMFRYNNRKDCNDRIRFENVMAGIFGKRLTYGELTGNLLAH
jgi:transposase-like protein